MIRGKKATIAGEIHHANAEIIRPNKLAEYAYEGCHSIGGLALVGKAHQPDPDPVRQ